MNIKEAKYLLLATNHYIDYLKSLSPAISTVKIICTEIDTMKELESKLLNKIKCLNK